MCIERTGYTGSNGDYCIMALVGTSQQVSAGVLRGQSSLHLGQLIESGQPYLRAEWWETHTCQLERNWNRTRTQLLQDLVKKNYCKPKYFGGKNISVLLKSAVVSIITPRIFDNLLLYIIYNIKSYKNIAFNLNKCFLRVAIIAIIVRSEVAIIAIIVRSLKYLGFMGFIWVYCSNGREWNRWVVEILHLITWWSKLDERKYTRCCKQIS